MNLWQSYRVELALNNAIGVIDFTDAHNNRISFEFKQKITGQTGTDAKKNVEIMIH